MRPARFGSLASFAAALVFAAGASAQIVLRDTPKRDLSGETPRWLGKTGVKTPARRRVLIDVNLRRIDASEVDIGPSQIRYRDANGRMASVETASVIAMLPAAPVVVNAPGSAKGIEWREIADVATGPQGRVELVDGQVIPGHLVAGVIEGSAKADSIAWEHPLLGRIELPIDSISRVVFKNDAGRVSKMGKVNEPSNDVVWFTNGDVARGVVESISIVAPEPAFTPDAATAPGPHELEPEESGELAMDVAGKPFKTVLSRVAAVAFSNPRKEPSGVFAWLRDGTVIGGNAGELTAAGLTLTDGTLGSTAGSHALTIRWDEIVGLNMNVAGVVPLSTLTMTEVKAGEGREWAIVPKVESKEKSAGGVGEIELSGPIVVTWALPSPAKLVAMTASLHPAARMLGDCVLVVECGGETVRQRLNGEKPTAEVRLTPGDVGKAGTIRVTIESGEGGSIQDRVVLQRALVVMGKKALGTGH